MGSGADKRNIKKLLKEIATAKVECSCTKDTYDVCKHTGDETCKCVIDRMDKYCGREMVGR